jgi:antirestriction protein ArdC
MTTANNYERITASILKALDGDLPAWRRPWRTLRNEGAATMPANAVTGRTYRGINVFILWARHDADMRYLTFNQARQLGGSVKKGEKGTQVVFWQPTKYKATDAVTGEEKNRNGLLMKVYTVFNVAQCENLKLPKREPVDTTTPAQMADVFAKVGARVEHGGDRAYYAPGPDFIGMPLAAAFTDTDAYAATALHELTHWTGHNDRLARDFTGRFGTQAYAAEELVAELGAAFLCGALGINNQLEHHASYIANWRTLLKDDPRAVITAASKAQAAADLLLAKIGEQGSAEADDTADELAEAA